MIIELPMLGICLLVGVLKLRLEHSDVVNFSSVTTGKKSRISNINYDKEHKDVCM